MSLATKYSFIPGVNIQKPWSDLILSGVKTVETRSYPLPAKYRNKPLAVIETPGPRKLIPRARIVGVVIFEDSFQYSNKKEWLNDFNRHRVDAGDLLYSFSGQKPKYGWKVKYIKEFKNPVSPPSSRGIVFASRCKIPSSSLPA